MEDQLIKLQATLEIILENQAILMGSLTPTLGELEEKSRQKYQSTFKGRIAQKITELGGKG